MAHREQSSASSPASQPSSVSVVVLPASAGQRLDQFVAGQLPEFSRAHLQRAIAAGGILVNGVVAKRSHKVQAGETVEICQLEVPREGPQPQAIPLDILYEDDVLAVVNKPAGMIVHPARGHWDGTLASGLAHHFGQLSGVGGPARPGIVHRLDRETSGVIVVAKTDPVHDALARQFKDRQVEKRYLAITVGVPDRDQDAIEQPIGDHPTQREKMAIRAGHVTSRDALTYFEVIERYRGFGLLAVRPQTGRTHQIRLHLAHIGCPVLCDRLYGGRSRLTEGDLAGQPGTGAVLLARQALHAHRLTFTHPTSGERLSIEAPLPADIERTLTRLAQFCG